MIHVVLITEAECWTCKYSKFVDSLKMALQCKTCGGDTYHEPCFMICILLKAFIGQYIGTLCGDKSASNCM